MNPFNLPPTAGITPRLRYTQDGRGGTIYYDSPEASFSMWYEFALSPALVIIGIPESRFWVSQTKIPLSQREAVLTFIGEQVLKDQVSGYGYFDYNDTIM
ncbi:MAG: hypothetical protein EOO39_44405, partial [Cytophagaceae bacterium]